MLVNRWSVLMHQPEGVCVCVSFTHHILFMSNVLIFLITTLFQTEKHFLLCVCVCVLMSYGAVYNHLVQICGGG